MKIKRTCTIVAALFIAGCTQPSATQNPATRPAAQTAHQPALKAVDLRYGVYLARIEIQTTITPDGLLHSVRTDNKSYGPNDIGAQHERHEIREGRLTPAQCAELANMFTGWETLSDQPYGGVADGPDVHLRYGDKTVSGGSALPPQVQAIQRRITDLATQMPTTGQ